MGLTGYFNSAVAMLSNPLVKGVVANTPLLKRLSDLNKQYVGLDFPLAWKVFNGLAEAALPGSLNRSYGIYMASTPGRGAATPLGQISPLQMLQLVSTTSDVAAKASTAAFFVATPGSQTTLGSAGISLARPQGALLPALAMQAGLGYDPLSRNSNSFAGTILRAAGLAALVPQALTGRAPAFGNSFTAWTTDDQAAQAVIAAAMKALGL